MLQEKVALVTGAASGIGRAVALAYAREGARILVSDLDPRGGEETVDQVKALGAEAIFVETDVSRPEACRALCERAVARFGRLDATCNNAGIGGELALTAEYPLVAWQQVIEVNLSGVFYCMKYQIPQMLKSGGGSIVNMASILGKVGFGNAAAYTAAKHGVLGLTQVAVLEYGAQGVRVNAVGPGFVHTPMIERLEQDEAARGALVARHPIGRLGRPEEIAELVVWLSSSPASFVTGAYYPVDGGYLAQ